MKRWSEWAAKPVEERKHKGQGVGEWIYEDEKTVKPVSNRPRYAGPYVSWAEDKAAVEEINRQQHELDYGLKDSLTPGAKQLNWKTPTEFPMIPTEISSTPLQDYLSRLTKGAIYTRSHWGESPVYDAAMAEFPIYEEDIEFFASGISKVRLSTVPIVHEKEFSEDVIGKYLFTSLKQVCISEDTF